MRKFNQLLFLILFALAACFAWPAMAAIEAGQPAPVLQIKTLDAQSFDLSALKGKVVIIHFWATWCPSCREEMPVLDAVYQHDHAAGIEVLGVSTDRPRARDDVVAFMQKLHFPAALISDATTNGFDAPRVLPITYLIDKKGVVRKIMTPDSTTLSESELESAVAKLMAETAP